MVATDADSSIGAPETELPETLKSIRIDYDTLHQSPDAEVDLDSMIEAGLGLLRGGSAPEGKTQTATGPGQAQALSCAKVLAVPVGQRREVSLEETDTQPAFYLILN